MTVNAIPLRSSVLICQMEPTAETIGQRILKRRKDKGIARGELAKAVGLAYSTLADIENGLQNSTTKLHKVATHLGVRIEWLETGAAPVERVDGVRDEPPVTHDIPVGPDGALLGAEWEKIEDGDIRRLLHDFIHGVVLAQKRNGRAPADRLATTERTHKVSDPRRARLRRR